MSEPGVTEVPVEEVKEDTAPRDIGSFMEQEYPVEPETKEEPKQDAPVEDKKEEPPTKEENPDESGVKLPPELKADADKEEKKEEPPEVDLAEIEELEKNPALKPDIAKNMGNMRKIIQSKNERIEKIESLVSTLREAGVLDENNNLLENGGSVELKAELNAAYEKLGAYNLMEDPRFRATYVDPINNVAKSVEALVKEYTENDDVTASQVVLDLVKMSPKERIAAINEYMPDAAPYVAQHLIRIDEMFAMLNEALKEHQATKAQLEEQRILEEKGRVAAFRDGLREEVVSELVGEGVDILGHRPGNTEYNQFVDNILKDTEELVNSQDVRVQTKAIVMGRAMPVYKAMYEDQLKVVDSLKAELAEYKKSTPQLKGTADTSGDVSGVDVSNNESIIAMLASNAAKR
jgi:hypothetical protein